MIGKIDLSASSVFRTEKALLLIINKLNEIIDILNSKKKPIRKKDAGKVRQVSKEG